MKKRHLLQFRARVIASQQSRWRPQAALKQEAEKQMFLSDVDPGNAFEPRK
jgi:hypothetical protein